MKSIKRKWLARRVDAKNRTINKLDKRYDVILSIYGEVPDYTHDRLMREYDIRLAMSKH